MRPRAGFSVLELLLVIAVVVLLVFFLAVPAGKSESGKRARIACVQNLKNLGLGARIFSSSKGAGLPGESFAGVTNGVDAVRYFRLFGTELSSPEMLHCPADKMRQPATSFQTLSTAGISYFGSITASESNPADFLIGDRNLQIAGVDISAGVVPLSSNRVVTWSNEMHGSVGNMAMADGSVQQFTTERLQQAVTGMGGATNLLIFP